MAGDHNGTLDETAQSVCAVIVTYHPTVKNIEQMSDVFAQVQGLVVVDNGSNTEELHALRALSRDIGFRLIENGENLGIAEALNQGVRWAESQSYPWVILFDQDSRITDGCVNQMFIAWGSHLERERIGSIYPRYADPDTGIEAIVPRAIDGSPILPMTSGTLIPIWIFDRIGLFASEYFIDLVDWEFCLRIRDAGYLVADAQQARLIHAAGTPERTPIWVWTVYPSHHNAVRRYYISRNSVAFYRRYFFSFPGLILRCVYRQVYDMTVCMFAEEDRARKFRNFILGTWDGLFQRMGRREGL
jgi:rhamnosyltransferase